MSNRPLTRTWEPTPEVAGSQWTLDDEGETGLWAFLTRRERHNVTTADYDVPHTQITWEWGVESARDGRTIAEGVETGELTAKRAAEAALDQAITDPTPDR